MKKLISVLFFCLILFTVFTGLALAKDDKVIIYFFYGKTCPHCAKEKVFLEKLVKKYPQVELKELAVEKPENVELWQKACSELDAQIGYTPFTVIGSRYFVGYLEEETTGVKIEEAVKLAIDRGCTNILSEHDGSVPCPEEEKKIDIPETIKIPLINKSLRIKNLSLPILTIVLGVLDGFNPCAMWTLLFLISLLLGMKDRKRMWTLGIAFIVTSAFVYFLFMTAWLNLFLFLGFVKWIRIIIGIIALGAGFYSLRDYFTNKEMACKVTGGKRRQKIFERMKAITQKKELLFALGGIILLAVAVNMVELVCSAGLPAIYTQVLSISNLSGIQYYAYILAYVFFFMVDDLFVFFTAMTTLKAVGVDTKYARFSRLIGGLIIMILGILLIFKPQWLMFV